jgi:hypothetical protein
MDEEIGCDDGSDTRYSGKRERKTEREVGGDREMMHVEEEEAIKTCVMLEKSEGGKWFEKKKRFKVRLRRRISSWQLPA